jgi:hypothetical protein
MAVLAAGFDTSVLRAQESAPVLATGTDPDPYVLAADRVRFWDRGAVRWVLLEGQTSVLQGTEGLRADASLVRIERLEDEGAYRIEVYAEGQVRLTESAGRESAQSRMTRTASTAIRLRAHDGSAPSRLDEPPDDCALLARGFPKPAEPTPPAEPLAQAAAPVNAPAMTDPAVVPAQFEAEGFQDPIAGSGADEMEGLPAIDEPLPPLGDGLLPGFDLAPETELPNLPPAVVEPGADAGFGSKLPMTRRVVNIYPKDSGGLLTPEVKIEPDGRVRIFLRGGVNVITELPERGMADATADSAMIWTRFGNGDQPRSGANVAQLSLDPDQPLEIYLEGNVVFRQDDRKLAGPSDQKIVEADQFYMDFVRQWFVADNARLNVFDGRFLTPIRIQGERIQQYRAVEGRNEQGDLVYGPSEVQVDRGLITGSRFPKPGYRFTSRSIGMRQVPGEPGRDGADPNAPVPPAWEIDARSNAFFVGPVPLFYWPRIVTETDDLDPPLRQIGFRANNYFGQQLLTDWNMFKLLGLRRPGYVDVWNLDVDYLSERGIGVGSELGWSGTDLMANLRSTITGERLIPGADRPYFGYFDVWGIREQRGVDTLGPGPAVITNGPPGAGTRGFQRDNVPNYMDFRGRILARHMQSLMPLEAAFDEDMRIQFEGAYTSDRHFLEQYYKNLFDSGLDQKTLVYFIYQKENRAVTAITSANTQQWLTDSQHFPKVEYQRLGDSILGDYFTWSQRWGASYTNMHTDVMVNNPDIFSFQPFDPVSATSGAFRTGRLWTAHELQLPIDLDFIRISPYVQGQLTGWDNQYQDEMPSLDLVTTLPNTDYIRGAQGAMLGRYWGRAGARANVMLWNRFPNVESELLNVHGLMHKVNFDVDYGTSYSNTGLGRIGLTDDLDDNTYEYVRRYFALYNYEGGILPPQFDPRYLTLRRFVSPISGSTDVQDTIQAVQMGIHQRLQTKRGPEGRRRVTDWMILDLQTSYFPLASRDNFGKPFGQNTYNYEWYIGDRTSLISNGWFEFWEITGDPKLHASNTDSGPFGMYTVTNGISLNRPPRGNVFIGYSVINAWPITTTSALNVSFSYWLSPKWYTSCSTSYDFGNAILLGSTVGITRIGADFLTSLGLTVDPQRQSYQFGFELTPRLSPGLRIGSGGGVTRFDPRYAATQ